MKASVSDNYTKAEAARPMAIYVPNLKKIFSGNNCARYHMPKWWNFRWN